MTWREELQPARFREAGFEVEGSDLAGGRRLQVHEYPQAPGDPPKPPFVEDLGGKAEELRISAFVLGEDVKAKRAALLAALRARGPGLLVHPLYGQMQVCVLTWSSADRSDEGGWCRFDVVFVEAGRQQQPEAAYDTPARVAAAGGAAKTAVAAELDGSLDVRGPAWLAQSAAETVQPALERLQALASELVPAEAADAVRQLGATRSGLDGLLRGGFGGALQAAFAPLAGLAPMALIRGLQSLFDYGRDRPLVVKAEAAALQGDGAAAWPTPSRAREAANALAIAQGVRRLALVEAVQAGSRRDVETYEDAVVWRGEVTERLDRTLEDCRDDAVFEALRALRLEALRALRLEAVRDLDRRAVAMPGLMRLQPAEVTPAVVLAWRLYGDATRADEIAQRNGLVHPGFVPAETLTLLDR